jgi:CheY-like chemotaxis protein
LQLLFDVDPGLPEELLGDPVRLRQVLLNLLGNAIKFTHEGEIRLRAGSDGADADGNCFRLHFSVKDTGIGIPTEKQGTIFEAFEQADSSTTRHYGGTGLGLAISSQFVRVMGGRMWVESEVGKGSTFHFTALASAVPDILPIPVSAKAAERPLAAGLSVQKPVEATDNATMPQAERKLLRILVAEDNAVNQKLAVAILKILGHQVEVADNGEEAWEKWRSGQFDLIMMDVQMPEMDAFEATGRIRADEQNSGAHAAIIAMTAHAMMVDRERCLDAGMDDYVSKPVSRKSIFEVIARQNIRVSLSRCARAGVAE